MIDRKKSRKGFFSLTLTLVVPVLLSSCYAVQYDYKIPEGDADCPSGMQHRNGGSAIVDRNGGSKIVDRDSDDVMDYCFIPNCPGTWDDTVPAEIIWHQDDHHIVTAKRRCIP